MPQPVGRSTRCSPGPCGGAWQRVSALPCPSGRRHLGRSGSRACFDFADQFVVYVTGVAEGHRDAVAERLGREQVHELARMLYVFDMTDRLVLSLGRLFPPRSQDGADGAVAPVEQQPLGAAVEACTRPRCCSTRSTRSTTELVRLHCARYHDCKT